jgi:cytoskeleton protein RodZ
MSAPATTVAAAAPAPREAATPASASATGAAAVGALRLAAAGTSWVEVLDARGQVVFSRTLQAGESAAVDGVAPLRLVVGNAGATSVVWRGRPVDLGELARSNVARFELR